MTSRRPRSSRRAALLIFLALGLAGALGALAFAVSWSATSGYGLSTADAARVRLEAARSSLEDAAVVALEGTIGAGAPPELLDLRDRLFGALQEKLDTGKPTVAEFQGISVEVHVPPASLPALALPAGDVRVEEIVFRLHGFRPVSYGEDGAFARTELFYHESKFQDETKDLRPRDFAGYFTMDLIVTARERGATARKVFRATRDAKVLDVTPPAREFGVFSYGVPPDPKYMLNDLNSGGHFTLFAKGSRAFLRGPLFLKVEDAADPVHIGGDDRPHPSLSFPEKGRDWHGWAFIPGPREVHMSNFTGDIREILGSLAGILGAKGVQPHPRRPPAEEDRVKFSFFGFNFPGVVLIGPALSPALGAFYPIPPDEQIACANPWVYLTGVLPPGKQTFSLAGESDDFDGFSEGTRTAMYDGVLTRKGGRAQGSYKEGLRFPHEVYQGGEKVKDGDAVYPEPFSYETVAKSGRQGPLDQGIYGIYKIAEFRREPVQSFQLIELLSGFWPPAKALVLGAETLFKRLSLTPDIWVILMHWKAKAPADLPDALDPEFLTQVVEKKQYFIAPYGLYYESEQNREVLLEAATVLLGIGFGVFSNKLVGGLKAKIFREKEDEAAQLGDKAVQKLKEKVFDTKLPRHAEKAEKLTHGALQWAADNFVGDSIKDVLKKIVASMFMGATEGLTFVATWKAIGYMRLRHLRAALGEIATWEPPPRSNDLVADFPKGLFPPKYRPYQRIASRTYATFAELLERQTGPDGVLVVDDVVMVRELNHRSGRAIRYRGRGAIVALAGKTPDGPVLDAPVVRADRESYLTLVVEDLSDDALVESSAGTVALGPVFQGTVYASSGARPAGEKTLILGNLVTIHLRKSAIAKTARLDVVYDADRLPLAKDTRGRRDWWRLSVSPRSAGLEE